MQPNVLVRDRLAACRLGPITRYRNLTMFPLLNGTSRERARPGRTGAAGADVEPGYLVLDEALAAGTARVTEVSEAGRAQRAPPELRFLNEGDRPVLLLDGEELIGAKQIRVLNLTILAPGKQALIIPVSCVEAGRWSPRSAAFAAAPCAQYAAGRAMRTAQVTDSLRERGERTSDQGAIWADIDARASRLGAASPTHAMEAIYHHHTATIEDYVQFLPPAAGQVGALFCIHGDLIGLDLFDHPATLAKLLPKLVRSYALDAIDAAGARAQKPEPAAAQAFLDATAKAAVETFPAVGLGEDARLAAPHLAGGGLLADGRVVHLAVFNLPAGEPGAAARLARASVRRGHREGE
jgi:hypothetical protein